MKTPIKIMLSVMLVGVCAAGVYLLLKRRKGESENAEPEEQGADAAGAAAKPKKPTEVAAANFIRSPIGAKGKGIVQADPKALPTSGVASKGNTGRRKGLTL